MHFLTRRQWMVVSGFMTATIVIAVSTACNALSTQSSIAPQHASSELTPIAAASNVVTIEGFQFKPDALTVKLGSTVTFINKDATPHTVTPENGAKFTGTGRLQKNASKSVTFNQVGVQSYFCEIHPSMKGKVTVVK
jgi:plastocyanin